MEGRAASQEPPAREKLWRWQELWAWVSWLLFPRFPLSLCDLVHLKQTDNPTTTKHFTCLWKGGVVFISPRLISLCFGDFSTSHLILLLVVQKERPLHASTGTFGQSGFSLWRKACLRDLHFPWCKGVCMAVQLSVCTGFLHFFHPNKFHLSSTMYQAQSLQIFNIPSEYTKLTVWIPNASFQVCARDVRFSNHERVLRAVPPFALGRKRGRHRWSPAEANLILTSHMFIPPPTLFSKEKYIDVPFQLITLCSSHGHG